MPNVTQMIEKAMGPSNIVLAQHERWIQEMRHDISMLKRDINNIKSFINSMAPDSDMATKSTDILKEVHVRLNRILGGESDT